MNAKGLAVVIIGAIGCRGVPAAPELPVDHPAHPAGIQAAFDPGPDPFAVTATFPLPGVTGPGHSPSGAPHAHGAPAPDGPGTRYTCPMHPEVVRSEPGPCPECGMALRPVQDHSHGKGDSQR